MNRATARANTPALSEAVACKRWIHIAQKPPHRRTLRVLEVRHIAVQGLRATRVPAMPA